MKTVTITNFANMHGEGKFDIKINKTIEINKDNFHLSTIGNFKQINEIPKEAIKIYESEYSISKYWISKDGKKLYRESDHWNNAIRSCSWLLNSKDDYANHGVIRIGEIEFENLIEKSDIENTINSFWNNIKNDFEKRKKFKIRKNAKVNKYFTFENIKNGFTFMPVKNLSFKK